MGNIQHHPRDRVVTTVAPWASSFVCKTREGTLPIIHSIVGNSILPGLTSLICTRAEAQRSSTHNATSAIWPRPTLRVFGHDESVMGRRVWIFTRADAFVASFPRCRTLKLRGNIPAAHLPRTSRELELLDSLITQGCSIWLNSTVFQSARKFRSLVLSRSKVIADISGMSPTHGVYSPLLSRAHLHLTSLTIDD